MNTIGPIISEYRKKKKLTQAELAELLSKDNINVTAKALSSWESNRTEPGIKALFSICRILEIEDIYEKMYGFNPFNRLSRFNEEGRSKINDYMDLLEKAGGYIKETAEVIPLPTRTIRLFNLPVSAGTGNFLDGDDYEEITVDSSVSAEADFAVHISGDSMEPAYKNGQIAFVHRQDTLENGEIGIFLLDGNAYCKKLVTSSAGTSLVSLNRKYAPIPVNEFIELTIFGKVVS